MSEYLPLVDASFSGNDIEPPLHVQLIKKGWKQEELPSFGYVMGYLYEVMDLYYKHICNSLLHRFFLILSNFQVNKDASIVLAEIITSVITDILIRRPKLQSSMAKKYYSKKYHNLEVVPGPILYDIALQYASTNKINRLTAVNIAELVSSLICILKPSSRQLSSSQ